MTKSSTAAAIRTIQSLRRLPNSVNGNPRYEITFTDGTVNRTKTDAGFAYAIYSGFEGKTFEVVTDGRGSIVDLRPTFKVER